jgi:hypothetical protein
MEEPPADARLQELQELVRPVRREHVMQTRAPDYQVSQELSGTPKPLPIYAEVSHRV